MDRFSYMGRPDGLGNRLEEIIKLECICSKMNVECDYLWLNQITDRIYDVCFTTKSVRIIENRVPGESVKKFSDFKVSYDQRDVLAASKLIAPSFNVRFKGNVKPVGVHIRGSDRIGGTHPQFMKDEKELGEYLSGAVDLINKSKPEYLFVCSENVQYKNVFLKHLDDDIKIVEPLHDPNISSEYVDFFALALCEEIYMASKFSSFSIMASLIGNIPLVAFFYDEDVKKRYMALFRYHLNFEKSIIKGRALKKSLFRRIKGKLLVALRSNGGC